jgi:hypothetical protein
LLKLCHNLCLSKGLYNQYLKREPDAGGLEFWNKGFGDSVDPLERASFLQAASPEISKNNLGSNELYDLTKSYWGGNLTTDSSGSASISIDLINDNLTEGSETFTLNINQLGLIASTVINDTSTANGSSVTPITPITPISPTPPPNQTFQTTNTISITPGNTINSSTANDLINGTTTIDTVLYSGSIRDYRVAKDVNGNYTVIDSASNRNGSDVVVNVERLQFSPDPATGANRIALDLSPTQATGKAALLIGAILPGKLALDPSKYQLMGTVIDLFDQGYSLKDL